MEEISNSEQGRVRRNSSEEANRDIDKNTLNNIKHYSTLSGKEITNRLAELSREWDVEKTLEVNASSLALTGLLLGSFVNRKWYILPGIVATFLLQHGLQGWCPPLPLFRKLGIRTRREIDEERYALKVFRGDFDDLSATSSPEAIYKSIKN